MDCVKCSRENTKYKCISCGLRVCQVCSLQAPSGTPGYSEEDKTLGFCSEACRPGPASQTSAKKRPAFSDHSETKPTSASGKQASLTSYFNLSKKQKKTDDSRDEEKDDKQAESESKEKGKKRMVSAETVERKWKRETLAAYDADKWLEYDIEKKNAVNLRCKVCKKYETNISGMKFFRREWITGSSNYRPSSAVDHAKSEPHKYAMRKFLREEEGKSVVETRQPGQKDIVEGIRYMNEKERTQLKRKFEVAYVVAKQELPLSSYDAILELEEHHGIEIGAPYRHSNACGSFIDFIGDAMAANLRQQLHDVKFFSVLWDGSTDVSAKEKETTFVMYLDKDSCPNQVEVKTSFLGLRDLDHANASGVKDTILDGFTKLGVDNFTTKLVGLGADGATVNRGDKQGVKALLQEEMPWLVFVWCMAHRLELALKESLRGTYFDVVDNMLLKMYYLYEKSPKKLRELKEIFDLVKESMEFNDGDGLKPVRASGTRWTAHKTAAIYRCIDKFDVYMTHLENVASDNTYKASDRAKITGYLRQWNTPKMLASLCFYRDILEPARRLSLMFQKESVDTVLAAEALVTVKNRLEKLSTKSVENFPSVKSMMAKISTTDGKSKYRSLDLGSDISTQLQLLERKKAAEIQSVQNALLSRLESNDSCYLDAVSQVLNSEGWERTMESGDADVDFADDHIDKLLEQFSKPLRDAGMKGSDTEVKEEWHGLLHYALKYLTPSSATYLKTWKRIFSSPRCQEEFPNILLLVELVFCFPVSTAKVERLFSHMKRVVSSKRSSLGTDRVESLLRIGQDGPPLKEFDANEAMELWGRSKRRRPGQKLKRQYKKRQSKKIQYQFETDDEDASSEEELAFDSGSEIEA